MKRVIFSLMATTMFSTASFANTPIVENEVETKNENQLEAVVNDKNEETCTVTCYAVMSDGTVYSASAGNWFTSCSSAETKCKAKLFDQIMGID